MVYNWLNRFSYYAIPRLAIGWLRMLLPNLDYMIHPYHGHTSTLLILASIPGFLRLCLPCGWLTWRDGWYTHQFITKYLVSSSQILWWHKDFCFCCSSKYMDLIAWCGFYLVERTQYISLLLATICAKKEPFFSTCGKPISQQPRVMGWKCKNNGCRLQRCISHSNVTEEQICAMCFVYTSENVLEQTSCT